MPASSLVGRSISIQIPELGVTIPAEISGTVSQGKPRLRKDDPNNRTKLHLVPLVMAAARLPDPAREDKAHKAVWPLENKGFLISHMDFDIAHRTATAAVLVPRTAQILHSHESIDLRERFANIAKDLLSVPELRKVHPTLADAIQLHGDTVSAGKNESAIRKAADVAISLQGKIYGTSNSAAVSTIANLPATPLEEDVIGQEGRILTRLHSYRERDRKLVKKAKALFKSKHGKLFCECCGLQSGLFYGPRGQDRIQAHHRRPMEELLPDSITRPEDLAMVCPNCHDIIHAKRPWITVEILKKELQALGSHYF